MTTPNSDNEFVTHVVELMQSIGPTSAKKMFGGHGIFLDQLMFSLVSNGVLYFKADEVTEAEFTAHGLQAFSYMKAGKEYTMSYYQAPEHALEDVEVMKLWANKAYQAALRSHRKKH